MACTERFPLDCEHYSPKDLGYSVDCRVPETDHLLVEMLQYKYHLAELFF